MEQKIIVFGVGKLPQVGGAIGKAIREFGEAQRGDDEEVEKTGKNEDSNKSIEYHKS